MIYYPKSILSLAFPVAFTSLIILGSSALFSNQGGARSNPPILGADPIPAQSLSFVKTDETTDKPDLTGSAQTVFVPQWLTEYDTILETRYCREPRQRTVRVYETVYENIPQVQTFTVQIPKQKMLLLLLLFNHRVQYLCCWGFHPTAAVLLPVVAPLLPVRFKD